MWLWLSWINQIFPIEYHGVTVHHRDDTQSQDLCSLCIIHNLAKQQGKHGVIHYEFTDLFTQLLLTWKTWGYNAYNDETPWKHYLHMTPWMESFDLSKPLRRGHIGAMASRITGNSTELLMRYCMTAVCMPLLVCKFDIIENTFFVVSNALYA